MSNGCAAAAAACSRPEACWRIRQNSEGWPAFFFFVIFFKIPFYGSQPLHRLFCWDLGVRGWERLDREEGEVVRVTYSSEKETFAFKAGGTRTISEPGLPKR